MERISMQGLPAEDIGAVLRFLEIYQKPAAIVSENLMVLEQTAGCALLLDHGRFFSLEDWLAPEACGEIARCIRGQEARMTAAEVDGTERLLRIVPAEDRALVIFDEMHRRMPALLLDAVRMRESAALLLHTAEQIERMPDGTRAAAQVRREAMRLLRQARHGEILGGGAVRLDCAHCDLGALADQVAEELCERGFSARADSSGDVCLPVDERLVKEAMLTLASNSIRFGGDGVRIAIQVQRSGDSVLVRIQDDGPGLSREAILRMEEGWQQDDAPLPGGEWGFGIPFASRVARLHGGRLHYLYSPSGCTACLTLRGGPADGLGAPELYAEGLPEAAEVELSSVLGAADYERL